MKHITVPKSEEESVYYSDFIGHCFGPFPPAVQVKFDFNYGSKYDGESITFHLTDEEVQPLFETIKKSIREEFKTFLKQRLVSYDERYGAAIESRDAMACEYLINGIELVKELLNLNSTKK